MTHVFVDKSCWECNLERDDVYELLLRVVPLIHCKLAYMDSVWLLTLALLGVEELEGKRFKGNRSQIIGTFSTHPPLRLTLELETVCTKDTTGGDEEVGNDDAALYSCVSLKCIELKPQL